MKKVNKKIIKLIKFWQKRIGDERLFLLVVILFAAVSFLIVVEDDFDGETWDMGNALLYAEEARVNKVSLVDYLNEKFPQGNVATNIYETDVMFIHLWQSLVYSGIKIFRSISFSVRFWLALIGFSTIITLYLIGKEIYGPRTGLFAAITLAISMFYVVHVKSGFGYYAIMPLLVLLLFYFFYLAHQRKEKNFLYLSGVMIFLLLFNGWPTMMLAAQIMAVFVLINFRFRNIPQLPKSIKAVWSRFLDGKGKSRLLGLRDYLLMFIIGGGLFFVFGLLYAWYFHGPKFDVFEKIYIFWYSSRATWFTHQMFLDLEKLRMNFYNLVMSLFWQVPFKETDGYLTTLSTPQYPMLFPLTTLFLLLGLAVISRRRLLFDKFCLIWIFFQILGTTLFAGFTIRNWLFAAPCLALIVGIGVNQSIEFIKEKVGNKLYRQVLLGLVVLGLITSVVSAYRYYFFYFVKRNSFLARAARQAEVAKFITSVASPEDSLIVFDSFNPLPKDAFYFFTSGKKYETLYYWNEVINVMEEDLPYKLAKWEREVLARKEKIVYLITEANYSHYPRGVKLWGLSGFDSFRYLHDDLSPAKVIYYPDGVPATKIYIVTREQPPLSKVELKLKKKIDSHFWLDEKGEVDFLEITGSLTNGKISINSYDLSFFPQIRLGEKIKLGKNHSQIVFAPLASLIESEPIINSKDNIKISQKEGSIFITSTASKGYVIYKIRNLASIKHVLFQTYPRINHDEEGKNKLTMQFSEDGIKYRTIYQIKSHKGKYWEWPYDKVVTHGVKANSQEVYIKFIFEGNPGETQLWSRPGNPTIFIATGKGWLTENLKLEKGLNRISYEAAEGELGITVSTQEKMSEAEAYCFYDQTGKRNCYSSPLEKGLYRLWLGTKIDQGMKYDFVDFYLPAKGIFNINQYVAKERELNLHFWTVIANENVFKAEDTFGEVGTVVDDPFSIAQKVAYAPTGWTSKGDLIDKNFTLEYGDYLLRVLAKLRENEKEKVAQIEVESVTRSEPLATSFIRGQDFQNKGSYQEFILPFAVNQLREVINFKLKFLGQSKLWLDKVELYSVVEKVEAEILSRGSGSIVVEDVEASGKQAVFEAIDASPIGGHIFLGDPKIKLKPGNYLVFYRMKVADNKLGKSVVRIDNASQDFNYGSKDIWCSEFSQVNQYQYLSLPLNSYTPDLPLEFRGIWYPKTTELWVDKIEVGKIIDEYQTEELSAGQIVVYDLNAAGGKALLARSKEEAKGNLVEGVLFNFKNQNLRVILRMKIGSGSNNQSIAAFKLFDLFNGEKIEEKLIKKSDFVRTGQYQYIWFDVEKSSNTLLGFELEFLGETDLWLDYIDFVPFD